MSEQSAEKDVTPDPAAVVENVRRLTERYAGFSVDAIDRAVLVERLRIILNGGRA